MAKPTLKPRQKPTPKKRTTLGGLTPLQSTWILHFTNADPEARTFMNATRAAEAAGYSGPYQNWCNCGYKNLSNCRVMARVDSLLASQYDPSRVTIDKVLTDLEITRLMALRDGQLSVARMCSRDQGQYLKMFVDRIEQVQTVEESTTEELAALLSSVLSKIDDPDITEILTGPSGTVTREGRIIPAQRNQGAYRDG